MPIAEPSLKTTGRALIGKIVADLSSDASELKAVLPIGVKDQDFLERSKNDGDTADVARYKKIKLGAPGRPPDGLSFQLYPIASPLAWEYVHEQGANIGWEIIQAWNSPPQNLFFTDMTEMFLDLTEAMELVIGYSALSNGGGAWNVLGKENPTEFELLYNPTVTQFQPLAYYTDPTVDQHQVIAYSRLLWYAKKFYPR